MQASLTLMVTLPVLLLVVSVPACAEERIGAERPQQQPEARYQGYVERAIENRQVVEGLMQYNPDGPRPRSARSGSSAAPSTPDRQAPTPLL